MDDSVIVMIDGEWRLGLAYGDVCCKGFYLVIKKSICQLDKPRQTISQQKKLDKNLLMVGKKLSQQ